MMTKMKLGTKFTLLLSAVSIFGIIIGGLVLWQVLQKNAQDDITTRGLILLQSMNAVRDYTSGHIRPLLEDDLYSQPEFIAETVPAFSAREVFQEFRQDDIYSQFLYKEASLNPTNPQDRADSFEAVLLQQMRREPNLTKISGYRSLADSSVYYIAQPLHMTSESCLACHGDPAAAPENLIVRYGSANGFGWQLGEVVAAQFIYVPAEEVFNAALQSFLLVMSIFVAIFLLAIVLINFLLRQYVIKPVGIMGRLAGKISADNVSDRDIEAAELAAITTRPDELGQMSRVFQQMARDVRERTRQLKNQVQLLRIEIDEIKQQQQVQEVVETDFFQDLQRKARQLRQRSGRQQDADR